MPTFIVDFNAERVRVEVEYRSFYGPHWNIYISADESQSYYVWDEYDNDVGDTVEGDFRQIISEARDGIFDIIAIINILKKHEDLRFSLD